MEKKEEGTRERGEKIEKTNWKLEIFQRIQSDCITSHRYTSLSHYGKIERM